MLTMKRSALAALVVVAALALAPAGTRAAGGSTKYPWNIPDNVRVVQKAPVDGVRTFATIQAAIDSITGASATNRFVVQVMPGTYVESIQAKDYVDIVGSGTDDTVLQADGTKPGAIIGTAPSMVAGFSVRNLTIISLGAGGYRYGIYLEGHSDTVTLRNVTVKMLIAGSTAIQQNIAFGPGPSKLEIHDSRIESTGEGNIAVSTGGSVLISKTVIDIDAGGGGEAIMAANPTILDSTISITVADSGYGVMVEAGVGTIVNSDITVRATRSDVENFGVVTYSSTTAIVRNSHVEVTVAATPTVAAALAGPNFVVDGSVLSGAAYGLRGRGTNNPGAANYTVNNSSISGGILAAFKDDQQPGLFRIGSSKLSGGHNLIPGVDKVVNSYDGDYNPLLNL